MKNHLIIAILIMAFAISAGAQSTQFSYQGTLKDGASAANGNYDFEFRLFDGANGGAQVGSTAPRNNIAVVNGTFAVSLDFGAGAFPGADRWLEVWLKPAGGGGGFQQLLPRTKLASSPYAIQSLNAANATTASNATQLGGVAANQYVVTTDPRMTNARTPTAGSANYIQNQNAGAQTASNFHISGNGTADGTLSANLLNATTQLNINSVRAFVINGQFSSPSFPSGLSNTFAGPGAGINTMPIPNVSAGNENSFFGARAGIAHVSGHRNSFFGSEAGESTTNGIRNSFFGAGAGESNISGSENAFFGVGAGSNNTEGSRNTFVGRSTGSSGALGDNNTALGYISRVSDNLQFATAIGSEAVASQSNSVFLGRPGGEDTVRIPGNLNITGATSMNGNLVFASGGVALFQSNITLTSLGTTNTNTHLCRNSSNQIAGCTTNFAERSEIESLTKELNEQKLRSETQNMLIGKQAELIESLIVSICKLDPAAALCKERK